MIRKVGSVVWVQNGDLRVVIMKRPTPEQPSRRAAIVYDLTTPMPTEVQDLGFFETRLLARQAAERLLGLPVTAEDSNG